VRRIRRSSFSLVLAAIAVAFSACSTSARTVTTEQALDSVDAPFSNVLVIGVAVDYEARSRFERKLASELRTTGSGATPLYIAAGGNKPIEREAIEELVKSEGYDAVLISKPLNRNSDAQMKTGGAATKAVRRDDGALHLFRYDYEELNEPVTWNVNLSVTIATELFAAKDSQRVWAIETDVSKKDSLENLINEASERIVRRLRKDGLVGK